MNLLSRVLRASRSRNARPAAEVGPLFNVTPETADGPAEILFYGDVFDATPRDWWTGEPIEGMHITVEDMVSKIDEIRDAQEVLIRLNSSGGDLFAGITLHNLLKGLPGKKTVRVEGLAASAASLIMCAGDEVSIYPSAMVMIHNPLSFVFDELSTQDVRDLLDAHEAARASMLKIYAAKTGKDEAELSDMVDATTWMTGQQAIDSGFADVLIEEAYKEGGGEEPVDPDDADDVTARVVDDGRYLMVAGVRHSLAGIKTLPPYLAAPNQGFHVAHAAMRHKASCGQGARKEQKGDVLDITTVAQLRDAYPDLVASIEADAVNAERERMRAIDSIAGRISDEAMVSEARYSAPKSAEALLMEAATSDKLVNTAFLAAVGDDEKESGADDVAANPAEDEDDEDAEKKKEDEMVNAAVRIFKGGM